MESIEVRQTPAFAAWFGALRDERAQARGSRLVILLAGGDKSSQRADIAAAIELAARLEE